MRWGSSKLGRRCLLATLACVGILGAPATAAAAEFGETAQFDLVSKGSVSTAGLHAFGSNPTDGSFYVADELKTGEFRVQRFNEKGEPKATVSFTPPAPTSKLQKEGEAEIGVGLQGIAVDPTKNRVYVLVVYKRRHATEKEEEEGKEPIDSEAEAVGDLYAFESKTETELVSLGKSGKPYVGETALKAQGEAPREALLSPHGIAVDPKTHDIVLLGREDLGGEEFRAAAQYILENGTPGARYVDESNCLEGGVGSPECEAGASPAFSPIVTTGGKLYAQRGSEIWALPASTTKVGTGAEEFETKPKRLFALQGGPLVETPEKPYEGESAGLDGTMSFVPEPAGGKIYLNSGILEDLPGGNIGAENPGALVLEYTESGETAEAKEVGWTGGQNATAGKCAVAISSVEQVLVAGGKAGSNQVLLFDAFEEPANKKKAAVAYVFGPEGKGCRHAELSAPSVKVKGTETSPRVGEEAELSSQVEEANAKSTEWKFKKLTGEPEPEQVPTAFQGQNTELVHVFKAAGEYEVTEIVQSDDLASPQLEKSATVKVLAPEVMKVSFTHPSPVTAGQAVRFTANVKDPGEPKEPHLKYVWEFGDGSSPASGTVSSGEFHESHTFASAKTYTVTLKVTDGLGTEEKFSQVVTVAAPPPPPPPSGGGGNPAPKQEPKTGGGVLPAMEVHNPAATIAGSSFSVTTKGLVTVKVTCPTGESSCIGNVTLKTASAVSASASHSAKKKAVLTLATASFTVAGGQLKALSLHLSSKARSLLARVQTLHAVAIVSAHDPSGVSHTSKVSLTLKLAKSHKH